LRVIVPVLSSTTNPCLRQIVLFNFLRLDSKED
jgi:hypothetical protein